jgi:L-arabinokinase
MTPASDPSASLPRFVSHLQVALQAHPRAKSEVAVSQAPGVLDVMGGISEDSHGLVLTAAIAFSCKSAVWRTAGNTVHIRLLTECGNGSTHDFESKIDALAASSADATAIILAACRQAKSEWAFPIALAVNKAIARGLLAGSDGGLFVLIQSDFPADADLGQSTVIPTCVVDALAKLSKSPLTCADKARLAAAAAFEATGLQSLRTALTTLAAPADGSLLSVRFHPQLGQEPLHMPPGVAVVAVRTHLARPTTRERMIETRTCTDMGLRMIHELQVKDGLPHDQNGNPLSTVTPEDYVGRYRDRMPSKITSKAFLSQFGTIRGLDDGDATRDIYKVRSRAEHHIYENKRVHDFATYLSRARRAENLQDLIEAGELMYASHWSYSQRCGIGGVETDRLVSAIRKQGVAAGLFGAKVTGGGSGGEIVVLMRDDERAHASLAAAIRQAEAISMRPVHTYRGYLAGAEQFTPPQLAGAAS